MRCPSRILSLDPDRGRRVPMQLLEIGIQNYKSLKSLTLKPGPLSMFIGPNGAGKSNLCDTLDFIGEIYRFGLERAVTGRGGYANIIRRQEADEQATLGLRVVASLSKDDLRPTWKAQSDRPVPSEVIITHSITIEASPDGDRVTFGVANETATYTVRTMATRMPKALLELSRDHKKASQTGTDVAE